VLQNARAARAPDHFFAVLRAAGLRAAVLRAAGLRAAGFAVRFAAGFAFAAVLRAAGLRAAGFAAARRVALALVVFVVAFAIVDVTPLSPRPERPPRYLLARFARRVFFALGKYFSLSVAKARR
jgi:hypothetical protein